MRECLSDISYEIIDSMIVLSATAIGSKPEDDIMAVMSKLVKVYKLDILRTFGFDIPIDVRTHVTEARGYEYWLSINKAELSKLPGTNVFKFEGVNIYIKEIPSCRYATLRIMDPFSDPFERIGSGWRRLVSWLEKYNFKDSGIIKCDNAYCLEEVKEAGEVTVMDIYVPVAKLKSQ
jgi:hypothetical protein